MPAGLSATVLPVPYPGPPYPGIGFYVDDGLDVPEAQRPQPLALEAKLNASVRTICLDRLRELTKNETLTWDEVLAGIRL